ncbi:hypothetical protein AK88_03778 [Plasmodium fragile]|uniref:Uncharacterized protein n=1 Tax=Plasmodium fragile TaxID=5857 RepID=A0A0D9QII2_PLAFR|nr:uncharacterized protein AK88_03778 [Plasmodium fragile]KJP86582.1 hypothetical protein AK88_03778 [Plasmodium fragile]
MRKFSDLVIFYLVFLLNFCLYKNGVQGYGVANEAIPSFRSGASNNDHSEQRTQGLNGRNGIHQNVHTSPRNYYGAVVGSSGTATVGNSHVTENTTEGSGNTEGDAGNTGNGTSGTASSGTSGTFNGALVRLFLNTVVKPALNFVIGGENPVFPPPSANIESQQQEEQGVISSQHPGPNPPTEEG